MNPVKASEYVSAFFVTPLVAINIYIYIPSTTTISYTHLRIIPSKNAKSRYYYKGSRSNLHNISLTLGKEEGHAITNTFYHIIKNKFSHYFDHWRRHQTC